MNDRYILLIASIAQANKTIIGVFVFALSVLAAYGSIAWIPDPLRNPMRGMFLLSVLAIFITVLFAGMR